MDLEQSPPDASMITRTLQLDDQFRLVRMDKALTGRTREQWYAGRLKRSLTDSDVCISLGAEVDGTLVGALMGLLQYGEFGQPEPMAILDTILVDPAFRGRGIGRALLSQLTKNLRALHIERLRTEVDWTDHELTQFLAHAGFAPVPRLVLELPLN